MNILTFHVKCDSPYVHPSNVPGDTFVGTFVGPADLVYLDTRRLKRIISETIYLHTLILSSEYNYPMTDKPNVHSI